MVAKKTQPPNGSWLARRGLLARQPPPPRSTAITTAIVYSFTIVRLTAAALVVSLVFAAGALAAGPEASPSDCAAAAAMAGEGGTRACSPTVHGGQAADPYAAPGVPPAGGVVAGPERQQPVSPVGVTGVNTVPDIGAIDEPLPRPETVAPPVGPAASGLPPGAGSGTVPAVAVEPIPERQSRPPTPMDLPLRAEPAPLTLPIVVEPARRGDTVPPAEGLSPLDRVATQRAKAAPGAAPGVVPRDEDSRLYVGLPWGSCGLSVPRQRRAKTTSSIKAPKMQTGVPVDASADRADYDRPGETLRLRGGVEMTQGDQHLEADYARYNRNSGTANARGNVFLEYPGMRVVSDTADFNLQTKVGRLDDVGYRMSGGLNMRGIADSAAFLSGDVGYYQDVTFTTCPPGKYDWSIRASDLRLDRANGVGTARNARLRVAGLPVFYTPYLRFPINGQRRSGFLIPLQGRGNKTGFDLILPYYWNIAPNLDMTLYPRYMSTRGLMLGAQVRGLTQNQTVEFNGQVLPHDDLQPDLGVRGSQRLTQTGTFGGRWSTSIDYSSVSDNQFLPDFGNSLSQTSIRNLIQRGNVGYSGKGFSVLAWIQGFQTVDATLSGASRPYTQLPHVQLDLTPGHWGPVEYRFATHFDYFDNIHRVNGSRFLLLPSVRMPLRKSYGFLIPQLRLYASGYSLANTGVDQPAQQSYLIPSLDLDSGLIFDRQSNWFGQGVLQTLEPRLYYVLTPNINQANAPLFDTTLRTFSYASLFWPNRFTGYDRVADENRLTVGLTTRTIGNKSGLEWLRVSLGQILYFANRRVQLSGVAPDTTQTSSLAGELSTNPAPGWLARASFQWNPNLSQNQLEQRVLQLRYAPGTDRMVNLTYRYSRGATELQTYENTDLSFRMPLKSGFGMVGRWLYSLAQGETAEAFAGIEYSGRCCWRVRLMGRQLKTSAESTGSTSIMLQIELAGLGAFGDRIDRLLENPNYGLYSD